MFVPLFRASLARSTQIVNLALRNVSRSIGIVSGNSLARAPSVAHPLLIRSTFATKAAKSATAKKPTTKSTTVAKRKVAAKKRGRPPAKKRPTSKKKKPVAKKRSVVKKKPKKKAVVKPKPPKIYKKDWRPPFKKPLASWAKFVTEFAKQHADGKPIVFKDQLRAASVEWKNMSDEQKAAYAPSPGDMEQYKHDLADWNSRLSSPVMQARRKWRRSRRNASPAPLAPMSQFVKEQYHQIKFPSDITTNIQKMQYMAQVFSSELSESDKVALRQRAEEEFKKRPVSA